MVGMSIAGLGRLRGFAAGHPSSARHARASGGQRGWSGKGITAHHESKMTVALAAVYRPDCEIVAAAQVRLRLGRASVNASASGVRVETKGLAEVISMWECPI